MKHLLLAAGTAVLLASPLATQAQLQLMGQAPARNAGAIPYATPLALTFSQPLSNGPASLGAVKAFGSQRGGRLAGTASVNGNVLSFAPVRSFAPGEQVSLSLSTAVQGSGGQLLSQPYVSQFGVAAVGGTGVFGGGSDPRLGSSPRELLTGDVDGDGDIDLLTAEWPNSTASTITVRFNDGVGNYPTSILLTAAHLISGFAMADMDGDGDLDLILTFGNEGQLQILSNDGFGQFVNGAGFSPGSYPSAVAAPDVDGDGDLDLLVVCTNGTGTVLEYLNNGNGTFASRATTITVGASNAGPNSIAVADLDSDGDLDFVTTNGFNSTLSTCLNNGTGGFSRSNITTVGTSTQRPSRVVLADVTGDGILDAVAVSTAFQAGTITVLPGNGLGQLGPGTDLALPTPTDLVLADVDGDHDLDLLAPNGQSAGLVYLSRNNGSGIFGPAVGIAVANFPNRIAAADVDGDGDMDLLALSQNFSGIASVRLNGGTAAPLASYAAQPTRQVPALYPNPAHEQVQVAVLAGATAVQLHDALGRLLRTVNVPAGASEANVSLAGLPAGVYVVRAGGAVQRLVVE